MGRVKCINNDFYGVDIVGRSRVSYRLFPSLKSLSVTFMENLTEWSSPSDGKWVVVFPCLENLSIQSCAKLTSFPFSDMSALVKIEFKDCEELRFLFHKKQSFPHHASLSIVGCPKLTELENWPLSKLHLREFSVGICQWLIFIPKDLGELTSLTTLEIYCCKRLKYLSDEIICGLTQLKRLTIGAFSKELEDFRYLNRVKDLPWLEEFELWGSDFFGREMSVIPNQLQHHTALKSLKIIGFTTMEAMPTWLTNLQSLESFSLNYCTNLGCELTVKIVQRLQFNASLPQLLSCP